MVRFQSVNDQKRCLSGSIGTTRTSWRRLPGTFPSSAPSLLLLCPHSCYHPAFVLYFLRPTRCLSPCGSSQDSEEDGKTSMTEVGRRGREVQQDLGFQKRNVPSSPRHPVTLQAGGCSEQSPFSWFHIKNQ